MLRTLQTFASTLLALLFAAPSTSQAQRIASHDAGEGPDVTELLQPVSMGIPVPRELDSLAINPAYDVDDEETMVDMRVISELRRTLKLGA